jgi:hypothetical protein
VSEAVSVFLAHHGTLEQLVEVLVKMFVDQEIVGAEGVNSTNAKGAQTSGAEHPADVRTEQPTEAADDAPTEEPANECPVDEQTGGASETGSGRAEQMDDASEAEAERSLSGDTDGDDDEPRPLGHGQAMVSARSASDCALDKAVQSAIYAGSAELLRSAISAEETNASAAVLRYARTELEMLENIERANAQLLDEPVLADGDGPNNNAPWDPATGQAGQDDQAGQANQANQAGTAAALAPGGWARIDGLVDSDASLNGTTVRLLQPVRSLRASNEYNAYFVRIADGTATKRLEVLMSHLVPISPPAGDANLTDANLTSFLDKISNSMLRRGTLPKDASRPEREKLPSFASLGSDVEKAKRIVRERVLFMVDAGYIPNGREDNGGRVLKLDFDDKSKEEWNKLLGTGRAVNLGTVCRSNRRRHGAFMDGAFMGCLLRYPCSSLAWRREPAPSERPFLRAEGLLPVSVQGTNGLYARQRGACQRRSAVVVE